MYTLTVAVNFTCMVAALWLGIYVVSRSSRSLVTWLTALTLLSVSGWFLNVLLAINPPPSPLYLPSWLKPFLWMWPAGLFQQGWGGWMQGWQVTPAIMFWHHATMLMRPGRMNAWRWTRVLSGYVIAILAIYVQLNTDLMFTEGEGDPLYLNTLHQGRLYPLFMGFLFMFTILSLINLLRSAKIAPALMPRRHLNILAAATLTAGLTGPTAFIAFAFDVALPRIILSALLGLAVFLMGYGVARYSALVERRVLGHDLLYNGVAMLSVVGLYLVVGWISMLTYGIPMAALAFIVILAIFTHSLVDVGRQMLDFVFFRRETREFRAKMRSLVSLVKDPQALEENLSSTFRTLCDSLRASYGMILVFESGNVSTLTSYRWDRGDVNFAPLQFLFDDVLQPEAGKYSEPLDDISLLIPLYAGAEQIGVLILGQPENALRYSQDDIEQLLDFSDQISNVIHAIQREKEYVTRLTELAQLPRPALDISHDTVPISIVEEGLRNLHDYACLGTGPLAELKQVRKAETVTHLDRGREVQRLLATAVEKLRPPGELPREPIPREWFPYLILHEAYIIGIQNRDIMSRLYISEGTFNRTRRAAIRALARTLAEMEYLA